MAEDLLLSKWDAFCLQLEAFYPLLRSFLANEMYSDLLAPDDTSTEPVSYTHLDQPKKANRKVALSRLNGTGKGFYEMGDPLERKALIMFNTAVR